MINKNRFNLEDLNRNQKEWLHIGIKGFNVFSKKSGLSLITSRPAIGKTSFLLEMTKGALINKNKVAYFSFSKIKIELTRLLISLTVNNCFKDIEDEDIKKFNSSSGDFQNLYLFDNLMTFKDLYNSILELDKEIKGIDLIIIDQIDELILNSHESFDKIYLILKILSTTLNAHIIVSKSMKYNSDCIPFFIPDIKDIYSCFDFVFLMYKQNDRKYPIFIDVYNKEQTEYKKIDEFKMKNLYHNKKGG